jgi:hypothetical protein
LRHGASKGELSRVTNKDEIDKVLNALMQNDAVQFSYKDYRDNRQKAMAFDYSESVITISLRIDVGRHR